MKHCTSEQRLWADIPLQLHKVFRQRHYTVVLVSYTQLQSGIIQCSIQTQWKSMMQVPGGVEGSLAAQHTTHKHTSPIHPAWYFLALPVSSIRLITHKKSRANVWSTPHTAAAQHQERRDTSVLMNNQETKQKKTISTLKLHIPAPFQIEHRQDGRSRDCALLASSRNSQGRARLRCQIQQLHSLHDDAGWRKCLGFLCKHRGSLKNFALLGLFS